MAKDTEKLIRQLSLISYLMAERRPVTALEIRRDVEGYSGMNEDAFARRFYADRSELEALGIRLTVDRPTDGAAEQENYSLRSEAFHLPPIAFTDQELFGLRTALTLLDGEFAYAEPLRLALQQITWGKPSPLAGPGPAGVALGITARADGHELSQHLQKIETAIFRSKTITFDYYTMERDEVEARRVDPYHLLFQGGQFYLLGRSHERDAIRVFRLSRIRGKVAYASKAEHDFKRPTDFDPRSYAHRAEWQFGDSIGTAELRISGRVAWHVERHFGPFGEVEHSDDDSGDILFRTPYASSRQLFGWLLRLGEHVRVVGPSELEEELNERLALLTERHTGALELAKSVGRPSETPDAAGSPTSKRDTPIRPERFARLVTLASILIEAGREQRLLELSDLCSQLQLSDSELREDINVLNVVNFGGGAYVLYADVRDDGKIEVDPDAYSDTFAQPARLLPVEAKALIAAIDLIGDHIPDVELSTARTKIVEALGADPMDQGLQVAARAGSDDSEVSAVVARAITESKLLAIEYYKANEDEFSERLIEPYALMNGREGWYIGAFDPERDDVRHFRLDRVKSAKVTRKGFTPRPDVNPAAAVEGWARTGEVEASRVARVWVAPERARWAREHRRIDEELADGSVIVQIPFKGTDWLVREVLAEAGDAAVISPDDARDSVLVAAEALRPVAR
jgi:proteasome accessory factor C